MLRMIVDRPAASYIILMLAVFNSSIVLSSESCTGKLFKVYDSTAYKNKSRDFLNDVEPLKIIYVHSFWKNLNDKEDLPSKDKVLDVATKIKVKNTNIVVDIEHWPLFINGVYLDANANKYNKIIEWMREARPDLTYGFYATIPVRDYRRSLLSNGNEEKEQWFSENGKLKELVSTVDSLYPSLYTVSDDPLRWKKMAIANLLEAKRISNGKPVYAFLWPQYHQGNKKKQGQYLDGEYWRLQLETVYDYADGIVVWGGWDNGPEEWNENANWWRETKSFIKQNKKKCKI